MAELQTKAETEPVPGQYLAQVVAQAPSNDAVSAEKASETTAAEDSKALVVEPETTPVPANKLSSRGSLDRDIALAELEKEKKNSYVKAWEENEKTKAENRAQKHLSAVAAWEEKKKVALELELKKIEEKLEKKKAGYVEKMKNKIALLHKQAEEKRAVAEAKRGEEHLKAEEMAAKYRATGTVPKKSVGCF
ncbi:remorin-like [Gastrolobium bilobum]|uniref:remorin-like n=1 Tax=Gastrolobium bilobum TaxID=150636 RepID=UPI002AB1F4CB|nr:remorin-like [Gastrolobium bilobum]